MSNDLKHQSLEFMNHYVGTWLNQMNSFPTEADPKPTSEVVIEQTDWQFDRSFVLARTMNLNTGLKSLWTITLDPNQKDYNFWYVDSGGWFDFWDFRRDPDDDLKVFGEAGVEAVDINLPRRWAGETRSSEVFKADGNYYGMLETYDEKGDKVVHLIGEKARQSSIVGDRLLGTWNEPETPNAPVPPETKRLDSLAGAWNVSVVESTAKAYQDLAPGDIQAAWILDGWALEIRVELGKKRAICIFSYDPLVKMYRFYVFSDTDVHQELFGEWEGEGDKSILVMKDLAKRFVNAATLSINFVNSDTIEAEVRIEPVDGNGVKMRLVLKRAS